jgi:non-homologous end joining protein Ku
MIDRKAKGQEITVSPTAPERGRGKIVDIFVALKQSLEQAAPQKQPATRQRAAKSARKRRKA